MIWKNHFSSLYNSVHADHVKLEVLSKLHDGNKCIGDDTKAAARQRLNCIKNKKIKYGEKRFSICDITDVNNYRAIALANVETKLLESVILDKVKMDNNYNDYQF